ncbi:prenyltransferase/squalene oxidase repeat-containing protein [Symmachiella dynata]|mgnify:CR=1 FL=1|uniref:prenyltransferase/squalene oxidase repeat-containing protein n=1 Tax=Symmachiella dynata TaxID=2527995 RepID=UPI003C6ED244
MRPIVKLNTYVSAVLVAGAVLLVPFVTMATAAEEGPAAKMVGPQLDALKKSRAQATKFLRASQADDGSWTSPMATGITALVTTSLLRSDVPVDDPMVAKALKNLEGFIQKDGGIYFDQSNHRNYETSICVLAFAAANADGRYDKTLAGAAKFLRGLQWDEDEGLTKSDDGYGGAGYGSHERPDLSNTQFFMEALKATGAGEDDPNIQNALLFVSRCQNLESQYNTTKFASKINDGGFYYTIAAGGTSQAGVELNGGLRSYGSMTYAGLKSMVYAGLDAEDKRVKAALQWITDHYTVSENPGMKQMGVFYYYHTFAKTLDTLDLQMLEDKDGDKHDWRKELAEILMQRQFENGSWLNTTPRWYEGDPNLATAYSLLALSYCQPQPVK